MLTSLAASLILGTAVGDISVQGDGYLRFAHDGRIVYAKSAKLAVTDGKLGAMSGEPLMPAIAVPSNTVRIEVSLEGAVTAILPSKEKCASGQIILASFKSDSELQQDGVFKIASTRPKLILPGSDMAGVIRTSDSAAAAASPKVSVPVQAAPEPTKPIQKPSAAKTPAPKPANDSYQGPIVITMKSEADLGNEKFTMADVADIKAKAADYERISGITLGYTPVAGVSYTIDRYKILSAMGAAGYKIKEFTLEMGSATRVRRQSQAVTNQQFIESAIAYAKTQVPASISFDSFDKARDFMAPQGSLELRPEKYTLQSDSATVIVAVYVDGRRVNSRSIKLNVRGASGQLLDRVPSGTRVKIIVRSNGAAITISGRTKAAAFVGQTVEAATDNRTSHTGVLVDPNTVEVKL